jgi:hypothetical protein
VPDDPPAAGPDRALEPPPPGASGLDVAEPDAAAVAVPEPVPEVALTMPKAPPPMASTAAPMAIALGSLRENMGAFRSLSADVSWRLHLTMRDLDENRMRQTKEIRVNAASS